MQDELSDERWAFECRMREREIALAERRLAHEIKSGTRQESWASPLVVAVLAAAVAATGNAIVSYVEGNQNRTLEVTRAEHARIQEMLETGDPDTAAENLRFLVDVGLVTDDRLRRSLIDFLEYRAPGEGPALASAVGSTRVPLPFDLIELRYLPVIGANLQRWNGCQDLAQADPFSANASNEESVYACLEEFLVASNREVKLALQIAPTQVLEWTREGAAPSDWRAQVGIAREQ